MLLSAGGFAIYLTESSVFNVLKPCFGSLAKPQNRQRLMNSWIRSKLFQRSGLDEREIRKQIMEDCLSPADFMRIVMEEISARQNVARWADCTPEHLLYIPEIRKAFPNALVIHMIRDGRDVALSLERQHWIRPLLSGTDSGLLAAGLYWEWMVQKGRALGRAIPSDYLEVRFEELVSSPQETLQGISAFIMQDLDYDQIKKTAIGSVKQPNTSFKSEPHSDRFAPVGRWKTALPTEVLTKFHAILGRTLGDLGYLAPEDQHQKTAPMIGMRRIYRIMFGTKLWLKKHTNWGRFFMGTDLSWL